MTRHAQDAAEARRTRGAAWPDAHHRPATSFACAPVSTGSAGKTRPAHDQCSRDEILIDLLPGTGTLMPLVDPHGGGGLRARCSSKATRSPRSVAARRHCRGSPSVSREKGDLVMLGIGGFTPLAGFMSRADWQGVCDDMTTRERPLSGRSRSRCLSAKPFAELRANRPGHRAHRSRRRRAAGDDDGRREIRDRQGARVRIACFRTTDEAASRRDAGDGSGRRESRGCRSSVLSTGGFRRRNSARFS